MSAGREGQRNAHSLALLGGNSVRGAPKASSSLGLLVSVSWRARADLAQDVSGVNAFSASKQAHSNELKVSPAGALRCRKRAAVFQAGGCHFQLLWSSISDERDEQINGIVHGLPMPSRRSSTSCWLSQGGDRRLAAHAWASARRWSASAPAYLINFRGRRAISAAMALRLMAWAPTHLKLQNCAAAALLRNGVRHTQHVQSWRKGMADDMPPSVA